MTTDTEVIRPTSKARSYLILACASGVAIGVGTHAVSPAMPVIQAHLGLSEQDVGIFIAAYMLPGVVMAIPLGMLVDLIGRRRVFCAMGLIFGLAGLAQGFTEHFPTILALRAVQGTGFAALMPLSITLIGDAYQGIAQVRAQAVRQVSLGTADFVHPVLGASLAAIAWNAPLFLQGAVLPLVVFGWFVLDDEGRRSGPRLAYVRSIRASVSRPGMRPLLLSGFSRFFFKFGLVTYLPLLLVSDRGLSVTQAGIVLGVASGMAAVVATQVARLLQFAAPSRWMVMSVVILALGLAAFSVVPSFPAALGAAFLYGLGDGTFGVLQSGYLTQAVSTDVRAGVVAVSGMIRNAGKFLAPLLLAVIITFIPLNMGFVVLAVIAAALTPAMSMLRHLDSVFKTPVGH